MKTLIVVDMQNDFIDGALANPAAQAIVPEMTDFIANFKGEIIFTRDTHYTDYLLTQEGRILPVPHCIIDTEGWHIRNVLKDAAAERCDKDPEMRYDFYVVDKENFGDITELADCIDEYYTDEIYICGTCTDICVISVALNLKARFPEIKMYCIADLCAGLTPEKHVAALEVMRSCQIEVI